MLLVRRKQNILDTNDYIFYRDNQNEHINFANTNVLSDVGNTSVNANIELRHPKSAKLVVDVEEKEDG